MPSSNTSFEHILHNIQQQDYILADAKNTTNDLFMHLFNLKESGVFFENALSNVHTRINSLYQQYQQTMMRFNLGIISFISEYYSIIDQNTDQFHSKYLHTYSGHRGHYSPIANSLITKLFNINDLIKIFDDHCYDLQHFKFHTNSSHGRRSRERTWIIYQNLSNYIASENVYDISNSLIYEFDSIASELLKTIDTYTPKSGTIRKNKHMQYRMDDLGVTMVNKLRSVIQQFNNIKLDYKPAEEIPDYCECGNVMQVLASTSEMVCDQSGYLYELKGTVFSDSQFYAQESIRYKHAGYEPSKHARSWLERIQARETNTITSIQIAKIEQCIKRDSITNKKRITIEQLRRYLKDTGLTELNEHVALIKRLITGVAPPQLTYAETQDITNSFAKAVKAYNIICPSNKSNLLYYPFIVANLIEQHVKDVTKCRQLLSFIHLQGQQTLVQNDKIWELICKAIPGFIYKPTDRYEYIDGF